MVLLSHFAFNVGTSYMQNYRDDCYSSSFNINVSNDSAVGIVTGCGLDDQGVGVRVPVESRIFFSACRPDWLWGPSSLLYYGY
jgi:hypothetical protein